MDDFPPDSSYRTYFEQSPVGVFVANERGEFLDVNDRGCELVGYSREQLLSMNVADLVGSRGVAAFERLGETGRVEAEVALTRADGRVVEVSLDAVALDEGDYIASVTDISQRKDDERRLVQYEHAVEQASDLIAAADREYTLLFANRRYRQFHDLSDGDVGTVTLPELLGSATFEAIESKLEMVLDGAPLRDEIGRTAADGTDRTLDVQYYPLERDDGAVFGIVATMRDVTEQERRRRQLTQFELAIESSNDWMAAVDTDLNLLFANQGFRSFHGLDASDVRGTPLSDVLDDSAFDFVRSRVATLRAGESLTFEHQTAVEGERIPVRSVVYPLEDDDGEILGFVAALQDISELKDRERQLHVLDRVLRHNVRTTMNVVAGYADQIRTVSADAEVGEYARTIIDHSEQLNEMVAKEREITKILSDPPRTTRIDLTREVDAITSEFERAHPEAVISTEGPETNVEVRAGALGRALRELVRNAVVHADRERPVVEIRTSVTPETVDVRVVDENRAIPEMEQEVLLKQAEIEPLVHGSGLGLWLVHLIVDRADGTLSFEANEPRGNVVGIHVPNAEDA